MIVYHDLRQVS